MAKNKVTRTDLRRLAQGRVFTTAELAEALRRSPSGAAKVAFDLKQRGFLTPVRRGVYASVPLEADPMTFRPDPFLSALRVMGGTYAFSHQSALVLHGAEPTVRKTLHVSAPGVRSRRRVARGLTIHVHSAPAASWKNATTTVRRGRDDLRVTSPERTLVDLASLPNSVQDYEEDLLAFRSLLPRVSQSRLLREVLAAPRASTRARVGHLLQASRAETPVPSRVLQAIQDSVAGAGPSYFATRPGVLLNRFDSRFQLVYPGAG
ncbi:MAG TPA: type IV toxin-antitoxin system AbiEi family antitoxin [Thermoplasmata archaeon]|nr:type IV toxin-antitoxin system AbiEi family antitoxin [Thermoplasmata archaeon]